MAQSIKETIAGSVKALEHFEPASLCGGIPSAAGTGRKGERRQAGLPPSAAGMCLDHNWQHPEHSLHPGGKRRSAKASDRLTHAKCKMHWWRGRPHISSHGGRGLSARQPTGRWAGGLMEAEHPVGTHGDNSGTNPGHLWWTSRDSHDGYRKTVRHVLHCPKLMSGDGGAHRGRACGSHGRLPDGK